MSKVSVGPSVPAPSTAGYQTTTLPPVVQGELLRTHAVGPALGPLDQLVGAPATAPPPSGASVEPAAAVVALPASSDPPSSEEQAATRSRPATARTSSRGTRDTERWGIGRM